VKQEPNEVALGAGSPSRKSPQVIDLTNSPDIKKEPVDLDNAINWKGKDKAKESETIDLTLDSDEE
jgi:hypothetical protein